MLNVVKDHWQILALVAIVGGTLVMCRASTGCFLAPGEPQPAAEAVVGQPTALSHKPIQGEEMSTTNTEGQVLHADEATFDDLVLQADVPVLVDFYADWCGPCKMIAPVLTEVAQETPEARVVKVDVDENRALASRYGISSIPSLLVFKDGQVVSQQAGLASKAQLKAMLGG